MRVDRVDDGAKQVGLLRNTKFSCPHKLQEFWPDFRMPNIKFPQSGKLSGARPLSYTLSDVVKQYILGYVLPFIKILKSSILSIKHDHKRSVFVGNLMFGK